MTETEAAMAAFARLTVDGDRDAEPLAALVPPADRIAAFSEGVRRKRLAAVRALLPGAARSADFDRAFLAFARRIGGLHGGHARDRDDAIGFARTLPGPVARADRLALEAARDRRSVAVAWVDRELRWWLRLRARGRLRHGRFRF